MADPPKIEQESIARNRLDDAVRELVELGWDEATIADAVEQAVAESEE